MTEEVNASGDRAYWFVGAVYGEKGDQSPRFIRDGIWENGYRDKYLELVRAIQPGDRIAIKSSYTRKHDLPFDNKGQSVSVMAIKAIGTVIRNPGDGRTVEVDWTLLDTPKEWYFFTYRGTVWRVLPGDWLSEALIAFAFEGRRQDYDRFRNEPYWRERYGDAPTEKRRFVWTPFYMSTADKMLAHREDRTKLVQAIHGISERVDGLSNLQDQYVDGSTGPLRDICPFTAFGIFNRGITEDNRKKIAGELSEFLDTEEAVPERFEGIPILNNQKSWFFGYERTRGSDDINALWSVFAAAIRFVDSDDPSARLDFIEAFDRATSVSGVLWNLTVGLYWIRPWNFVTLDQKSRQYIKDRLGFQLGRTGNKKMCSGREYLSLIESLEARFKEDNFAVHSFPELSLAAWNYQGQGSEDEEEDDEVEDRDEAIPAYSVDSIIHDGCFLNRDEISELVRRLRRKKNLILQGPPGTGKTWLAKRLAYALMRQQDESRVRAVQFHPNLSYEDFVRGWRPSADGKLALVDGPFLQMIKAAQNKADKEFVLVIEEINRGQPAQIFGEMLTLLEADKRTPLEALELCYRRELGERVFIPDNLYVIGTMNIADRSLALVDLALRRRFAFVDLEPRLGLVWKKWVNQKYGIAPECLDDVEQRILSLNEQISTDDSLGRQFRIGHSYVTPPVGSDSPIEDGKEWFVQIVKTEIGPLLEEYWFDAPQKAQAARQNLLKEL